MKVTTLRTLVVPAMPLLVYFTRIVPLMPVPSAVEN